MRIWVGLYAGAAGGILAIFVALTKGYLFQAVGNVGVHAGLLAGERRQAAAGNHARAQSRTAARVRGADPRRNDGDAVAQMKLPDGVGAAPPKRVVV